MQDMEKLAARIAVTLARIGLRLRPPSRELEEWQRATISSVRVEIPCMRRGGHWYRRSPDRPYGACTVCDARLR